MARHIDADELIVMEYGEIKFVPVEFINDAPTIEAVPVVRCRECRITQDERERIVSWLGKFCRHIDNFDISLNDDENTEFFKEKMYQQFGWEKASNCGARMEDEP